MHNTKTLLSIFIILAMTSLHATEKVETPNPPNMSLEDFHRDPSSFVNGSVNAITGDYNEVQTDVIVGGPEPLAFQRSYISSFNENGALCNGWNIFHFCQVQLETDLGCFGKVWDNGGGCAPYNDGKIQDPNVQPTTSSAAPVQQLKIHPQVLHKGITNSSGYQLGGTTNIKNNILTYVVRGKNLKSVSGDGTKRLFQQRRIGPKKEGGPLFDVICEIHPNGNEVRYTYDLLQKKNYRLTNLLLTNKHGHHMCSMAMTYDNKNRMEILTSDHQKVTYMFQKFSHDRYYLTEVIRPSAPHEKYVYSEKGKGLAEKLIKKERPDGRYLINEYYKKGKNRVGDITVDISSEYNPRLGRVMLQKAPVGHDETPITTHRYLYKIKTMQQEIQAGYTTVYDAYDNKTEFHYNDDQRLRKIARYGNTENASAYVTECFYWGGNYTPDSTNLLARTFENNQRHIQVCRSFRYDDLGNVSKETIWGNISGNNTHPIVLDGNGVPQFNGCENFTKSFEYSKDGFNLILSETDGKKTIEYTYLPNTNLTSSKITIADGKIQLREFFEYDMNGMITKSISDNGDTRVKNCLSGVTERHFIYTTRGNAAPVGLPVVVEEKYLDLASGSENLISRVVNTYTPHGHLARKEVYDSNGDFAYSQEWEYDAMGNVTMEKDALGHVVIRQYDANGNMTYEKGPRQDVYRTYTYDYMNRLIKEEEIHDDGVILTNSYRYDYLGNKVASTDSYGNETQYVYDSFSRLVSTIYPTVLDEEGAPYTPTDKTDYTVLNFPYQYTDTKGVSTSTEHNIHGNPTKVVYADGSKERYEYNLDGSLFRSWAKNGVCTLHFYDGMGRVIRKEMKSATGEVLTVSTATYNALHLLSETAPSGLTTTYEYDCAGRVTATTKGDTRTEFVYDSLGRVVKTKEFYGNGNADFFSKCQEYDLLNQVTAEWIEDSQGVVTKRVEYAYDESGNRTQTINVTQEGTAITTTCYDSRGVPVIITDPEGNTTVTTVRYDYYNAWGQLVPYHEVTDPMGNVTVTVKDALNRVANITRVNPYGQTTQKRDLFNDPLGLVARVVDTVITPNAPDRTVVTVTRYDSCKRLVELVQAAGAPEQKVTHIVYNTLGQKEEVVKPDGVSLLHTYDIFGRVASYSASDGSLHYVYEYDLNDHPVKVTDLVNNTTTEKIYDRHDRMIQETFGNGLKVSYNYDAQGRPTHVLFPDNTGAEYVYAANRLKEVHRLSANGTRVYSHSYTEWDPSGNIIKAQMIGEAGTLEYRVDIKGRVVEIGSKGGRESITEFDKAGNIVAARTEDSGGEVTTTYAYDDLYQLKLEQGDTSHTYENDSLYNRVNKDGKGHVINGLNQLLNDGEASYSYDDAGNLVEKSHGGIKTKYVYDAMDRLTSVTEGVVQYRYTYDELNRRLCKMQLVYNGVSGNWDQQSVVRYLYVGQNEVGAVNEDDVIRELRLLGVGLGAEIGASVAIEVDGVAYAPVHDHYGNIRCLIHAVTGQVAETYRYTAFGEESFYDGSGVGNSWRFSSKRVDSETGFVYFGRRYYSPEIGRWVTPDPAGYDAGPNLYAYVLNSPLIHFDLYGLFARDRGIGPPDHNRSGARLRSIDRDGARGESRFGQTVRDVADSIVRDVLPLRWLGDKLGNILSHFSRDSEEDEARSREVSRSSHYRVTGWHNPKTTTIFGNGVGNMLSNNFTSAESLNNALGGQEVISVHSNSWGLTVDLCAVAALKAGCITNSVLEMAEACKLALDQSERGSLMGHSRGAQEIYNLKYVLPSELRQRIDVETYGPAKIVPSSDWGSAVNYVSWFDIVPFLADPIGIAKSFFCKDYNVKFIRSKGYPMIDHGFMNETYQNIIQVQGRESQLRARGTR